MTDSPKRRAGWTEERTAKFQATKQKQAAENLAKYGTKMTPESIDKLHKSREERMTDRRDNTARLMHICLSCNSGFCH